MSTAHIICCNDSMELVVLDNEEQAQVKLNELADQHYDKAAMLNGQRFASRNYYNSIYYWHIHDIEYFKEQ